MNLTENLFRILLGLWSSGYDTTLFSEFFDEKINEKLNDIFPRTY